MYNDLISEIDNYTKLNKMLSVVKDVGLNKIVFNILDHDKFLSNILNEHTEISSSENLNNVLSKNVTYHVYISSMESALASIGNTIKEMFIKLWKYIEHAYKLFMDKLYRREKIYNEYLKMIDDAKNRTDKQYKYEKAVKTFYDGITIQEIVSFCLTLNQERARIDKLFFNTSTFSTFNFIFTNMKIKFENIKFAATEPTSEELDNIEIKQEFDTFITEQNVETGGFYNVSRIHDGIKGLIMFNKSMITESKKIKKYFDDEKNKSNELIKNITDEIKVKATKDKLVEIKLQEKKLHKLENALEMIETFVGNQLKLGIEKYLSCMS